MQQRHLLWAALFPLIAGAALALPQEEKPKPKNPAPPQGEPAVKVDKKEVKKGLPFCHKASEVIGAEVKNPKGEKLGKVEELVLDPASGSIEYAVISFGGFLGMGDKLFAVPFSLLKAPEVSDNSKMAFFTYDVDKAKMEKAPGFDKNNWPDVHEADWRNAVDQYYGSPSKAIDKNKEWRLTKASEVMGMNVTNPNNDDVGKIKELVLDPRRSRVSYFVMQSGGFLGMGDKSFAIPWTALTIDSKEKKDKLILNVTKERLEKAPEFVAKDWDRMSDPVWLGDVYKYYGVRPYWETEAPGG